MMFTRWRESTSLLLSAMLALSPTAVATRMLESNSLDPCMENSHFTANLFQVLFTPENDGLLTFNVTGVSDISGYVLADMEIIAYGYSAYHSVIDPCTNNNFAGLCPMSTGQIQIDANFNLPMSAVRQIPSIAYEFPDLDVQVKLTIVQNTTNQAVACVSAGLSNGKSVYQKAVGWVTAIIAGIALIASAVSSGMGHSNTAAHVAANAMSLFGYFQAQAFLGMSAVPLPPIVASWTQNFQWSMGIIRVGFLQSIATWYQRSTGGTPSEILSDLAISSVQVQKRSLEYLERMFSRAYKTLLLARSNNAQSLGGNNGNPIIIRGIERVGFRAGIETTNIFLTGYIFFLIFCLLVVAAVAAFKSVVELLVRSGKLRADAFQEFRNGWTTVLRGIMYRIILIGFPQMVVLCFWEFTENDSSAEIVLAVFTIISMLAILGWGCFKVVRTARRSIAMHKNPAYILYSDPGALNKWGFLYIQFKAAAYYFVVPMLAYIMLKGMFIGLAQKSGVVQAIALVVLDAAMLIAISILRPYMDKKINGFNIAIAAVNFLSAIFLLIFTGVFNQPGIVTGVIGVIFFVINCIFAIVLLVLVLLASGYALFSKNPDTRYQPMRDDRGSFIKSQTQLTTELDALGQAARGGDKEAPFVTAPGTNRLGEDDDQDSFSSNSVRREKQGMVGHYAPAPATPTPEPPSPYHSPYAREQQPMSYADRAMYNQQQMPYSPPGRSYSPASANDRSGSMRSMQSNPAPYRSQHNASPWQRGAGFDH